MLIELVVLSLIVDGTSSAGCDSCFSNQTCIKDDCYTTCAITVGGNVCDCFGDICYNEKWCNLESQKCCRTCQTDWLGVFAIILAMVGSIGLAVLYGELCLRRCKAYEGSERKSSVDKMGAETELVA